MERAASTVDIAVRRRHLARLVVAALVLVPILVAVPGRSDAGGGGSCTGQPNGIACNDGNACTQIDTCQSQQCVGASEVDCSDGISCTADTCDSGTGQCMSTPNNAACSDGAICNGTETCDANTGCQAGTTLNCDDGVSCTADVCQEGSACSNTPVHVACNDGIPGTDDVCTASGCTNTPNADTTDPVCNLEEINGRTIGGSVDDADSGLKTIEITKKRNLKLTPPDFDEGDLQAAISAKKKDRTRSAVLTLVVTDVGTNDTTCSLKLP